jgi:hypothetical protein
MKHTLSDEKKDTVRSNKNSFGFYSAILTTVLTVTAFGFAITAIPISGANCVNDCISYPYLDTAARFPQDFLWMPFAMILILAYVALMAAIHAAAPDSRKIFSQVGLSFSLITAAILLSDYFLQFSVIPASLLHHETDGLPLLIQYNPRGVFIALEELGYWMMSFSFLFMAPVFVGKSRLERSVRWVFLAAFGLTVAAFVTVSVLYGLERLERFEVAVISIDWLALILNGILLSRVFRRQSQPAEPSHSPLPAAE